MKRFKLPTADGGFTLLELIVVIVMIGILAALAGPHWFRAVTWRRVKLDGAKLHSTIEAARQKSITSGYRVNCFASFEGTRSIVECRHAGQREPVSWFDGASELVTVDSCKIGSIPLQTWSVGSYDVPIAQFEHGAIAPDIDGDTRTYTIALSRPGLDRCWSVGHDTLIGVPFSRELK